MIWLWWAPLAAAALHIAEEFAFPGGFAAWDRSYRPDIRKSISARFHVIINAALLLACLQVALLSKADDAPTQRIAVAAWLTLSALLFSNALFHAVGTLQTKRYSPGLVTAVTLYVPVTVYGYAHFLWSGEASVLTACAAAIVGGSYHLWAGLLHKLRAGSNRE